MSTSTSIPVVNLQHLLTPATREGAVKVLGDALARFGFVAIEGHGLSPEMLEGVYETSRNVFALDRETKDRCIDPADIRQRGYTGFGVEHAKDADVPDLKEFWHVGLELPEDHPERKNGMIPANIFPPEVPDFKERSLALFHFMEQLGLQVLDAVGQWLGKDPSFFRTLVKDGNSVLRIIHYPDVGEVPAGAVRAAAHEDINLITLLPASTRPGLELKTREGDWMAVTTPPGVIICDTGDMMALLTAGKLPATTHRVVNPEASDGGRMSIPFFMHPHGDSMLDPIEPGYADAVRTDDFLKERLRAIGL